jgi:hypothetical protein
MEYVHTLEACCRRNRDSQHKHKHKILIKINYDRGRCREMYPRKPSRGDSPKHGATAGGKEID